MFIFAFLTLVFVLVLMLAFGRRAPGPAAPPRRDDPGPFLPYGVPVVPGAPLEDSVFDNAGDGLLPGSDEFKPGGGNFGGGGASGDWDEDDHDDGDG